MGVEERITVWGEGVATSEKKDRKSKKEQKTISLSYFQNNKCHILSICRGTGYRRLPGNISKKRMQIVSTE